MKKMPTNSFKSLKINYFYYIYQLLAIKTQISEKFEMIIFVKSTGSGIRQLSLNSIYTYTISNFGQYTSPIWASVSLSLMGIMEVLTSYSCLKS